MPYRSGVEAHHRRRYPIQTIKIIPCDKLPDGPGLAIHWTVLVEPVGCIDDTETCLAEIRDKLEFSVQLGVLQEAQVEGTATPQVLNRKANSRHDMNL